MVARSLVLVVAVVVAAACSPNPSPAAVGSGQSVTDGAATATVSATSTPLSARATTTTMLAPSASTATKTASTARPVTTRPPAGATTTGASDTAAGIAPLSDLRKAKMTGVSWHTGCPVALDDLRLLTITYTGFDGADHKGQLIVHKNVASAVVGVFDQLHAAGFPIEGVQPVDAYGGSDDESVKANNTSAFNCRAVYGGTSWSRHAYGKAIDINPLQNPYVYGDGHVFDPNAARYTNRGLREPGMIHDGDVVTSAFAAIRWRWGGHFAPPIDYQHFDTA